MDYLIEAVGWTGMVLLLGAYALRERLSPRPYALMNLAGAAGVAVVCLWKATWPALALETAWAAIALRDLSRTGRRK